MVRRASAHEQHQAEHSSNQHQHVGNSPVFGYCRQDLEAREGLVGSCEVLTRFPGCSCHPSLGRQWGLYSQRNPDNGPSAPLAACR